VTKITEINGWVVTGDYAGITMHVSSEEADKNNSDFEIGMIGRKKRESDVKKLEVMHAVLNCSIKFTINSTEGQKTPIEFLCQRSLDYAIMMA